MTLPVPQLLDIAIVTGAALLAVLLTSITGRTHSGRVRPRRIDSQTFSNILI
jgi:hypothetical protein